MKKNKTTKLSTTFSWATLKAVGRLTKALHSLDCVHITGSKAPLFAGANGPFRCSFARGSISSRARCAARASASSTSCSNNPTSMPCPLPATPTRHAASCRPASSGRSTRGLSRRYPMLRACRSIGMISTHSPRLARCAICRVSALCSTSNVGPMAPKTSRLRRNGRRFLIPAGRLRPKGGRAKNHSFVERLQVFTEREGGGRESPSGIRVQR